MSALLKPPKFADDDAFLAWEEAQAERYEYVDGEVYAMVGARLTHNTIALNAAFWLRQALRGGPCRVYSEAVKLRVNERGNFLYPDILVTCDPRDRESAEDRYIQFPWLVVEVLSESTAAYDRGRKFQLYRQSEALTHYLLVEQDRASADLFFKNAQGQWVLQAMGEGDQLTMERLGKPWPVMSLYEDIDFPTAPQTQAATA